MDIYRNFRNYRGRNTVVALGTFDGVHIGHQKILKGMVAFARRSHWSPVAITFDPHPQQVIVPERGLRLLTTPEERFKLFESLGIKATVVIHFNQRIQEMSYEEFVQSYLVKYLKPKKVFVGYDYAFGHDREGHVRQLEELGDRFGFAVSVISPVTADNVTVKSSLIRELISLGRFERAVQYLGHPFRMSGKVVHGSHRGKKLGFPTANLAIHPDKLLPGHGVYAGKVYIGRKVYRGAVNVGARPTFAEGRVAFEVHILDFHDDVRGKVIVVDLYHRLRDEMQFTDVNDLKHQIREDIVRTRRLIRLS